MSDQTTPNPQEQPRKEISAEEFTKIIKGDYEYDSDYDSFYKTVLGEEIIIFQNYEILDPVHLYDVKVADRRLHLENVLLLEIFIERSQFNEDIIITNKSYVGSVWIRDKSVVSHITIGNESIISDIFINGESTIDDIYIKNKSTLTKLEAVESFLHDIHTDHSINEKIDCKKCTVGNISLDNSTTKVFTFQESVVNTFYLTSASVTSINMNQCNTDSLYITHSSIKAAIFTNVNTGYITIRKSDLNDLRIIGYSQVSDLHIDYSLIQDIKLENLIINELIIRYLLVNSKSLKIENTLIYNVARIEVDIPYNISIRGSTRNKTAINVLDFRRVLISNNTNFIISDIYINRILMHSFFNNGKLVFSNISSINNLLSFQKINFSDYKRYTNGNDAGKYIFTPKQRKSNFNIINSDLGNTQFIGSDLVAFDKFIFKNSKMASVFLADTKLPHRNSITTTFGANQNEQRRLALSQFKKIYEGQGDVVRAMEYRAEELEVYKEVIKNQKKLPTRVERWNRRGELLNLGLNSYSNYYGNNWLKALFWTLVIPAILFTFYCSSRSIYPNPFVTDNWINFWEIFPYYFEFLNPIHKSDFFVHIKSGEPNPGALLIDYLSRIIIAYLVYQLITAFRKFGRKSA